MLLCQNDLEDALHETKSKTITDDDTWKKTNHKALCYIQLSLTSNVAKEMMAFGIIKVLSNMYEKPSSLNKLHLVRRLFNLRMPEGGSVAKHSSRRDDLELILHPTQLARQPHDTNHDITFHKPKHKARCKRFLGKSLIPSRYLCRESTIQIGIYGDAIGLLERIGLADFVERREHTYK